MTEPIEPHHELVIDSWVLSHAWLNAWQATGDDDIQLELYKTILVEVFDHGVQLICCDGRLVLGTFAPVVDTWAPHPEPSDAPLDSYVVMDHGQRGVALLKYVMREARDAIKNDYPIPELEVSVVTAERPSEPTLGAELDRLYVVIETERERVAMTVFGGEFPNWRKLLSGHVPEPAGSLAIRIPDFERLGKLQDFGAVRFIPHGSSGMIYIEAADEALLFGGLSPAAS